MIKDKWEVGEKAAFEYHCNPSHDSEHAEWWYRSHQTVVIIECDVNKESNILPSTFRERAEWAEPLIYKVRWEDGFEGDVFEDELLIDDSYFVSEFAPPPSEEIETVRKEHA